MRNILAGAGHAITAVTFPPAPIHDFISIIINAIHNFGVLPVNCEQVPQFMLGDIHLPERSFVISGTSICVCITPTFVETDGTLNAVAVNVVIHIMSTGPIVGVATCKSCAISHVLNNIVTYRATVLPYIKGLLSARNLIIERDINVFPSVSGHKSLIGFRLRL